MLLNPIFRYLANLILTCCDNHPSLFTFSDFCQLFALLHEIAVSASRDIVGGQLDRCNESSISLLHITIPQITRVKSEPTVPPGCQAAKHHDDHNRFAAL